jgi:hypothetical protein
MQDSIPDRYEHNPMLVLVENFVLDAIGKLDADKTARLDAIICRTFGGNNWRKTLQAQLDLPADTPATIAQLWKQRQEEAETKQENIAPEDFAREMADQLFADMGQ